jgi:hypothetical protein
MATAADYRKWAQECFQWARNARDEGVREQYMRLGEIWIEFAERAAVRSDQLGPMETTPAPKVA